MPCPESITNRLVTSTRLWLFLDYDGTLAEFAPTPEFIQPDQQVIDLLYELVKSPSIRLGVISGRMLSQLKALIPVPGVFLAGTYGIDLITPEGKTFNRLDYHSTRPILEVIKPIWQDLIADRQGFYLEDKGWSLALHGRFADESESDMVLDAAKGAAARRIESKAFRLLGGNKFLEVSPTIADKGQSVNYLLDNYPWHESLPLYLGDDDKDESAFREIKQHGGIAILVAAYPRESQADCRLDSVRCARSWLGELPNLIKGENAVIDRD